MYNKKFYEELYQDEQGKNSFEVRSKTEAFKFLIKKKGIYVNKKVVLDIGFGSGNILEILKKSGAICYGVEISQVAIDRLKKKGYRLKLAHGTILPYKKRFFDIVISSHTIEHVREEKKILEEIKRVLKPKGVFIMGVPTGKFKNPLHYRNYSENDIKRLSYYLGLDCIYSRNFGSPLFKLIYSFIRDMTSIMTRNGQSELNKVNSYNKNEFYRVSRLLYHKVVVNLLIFLYLIDSRLINNSGIEIWFIFCKNRLVSNNYK